MRYPKYKLAFPGKHVWIFNGKPMTQFDGYTLNTTAIGDGIVSANKLKGFYGDSAQIFLSAAPHNSFSAFSSQYGTIDGMTYYFGKHDDVLSAYFIAEDMRNVLLEQTLGGRISAIPMTGFDGTEVILSNTPSSHWNFNGYEITGATLSGDKFIFNGSDVTARALWNEDAKYNIILIQTNGGRISANKLTGYSGDIITLSNTPSSHYTFNSYGITGAELTGNQFRIVGNVSVDASWIQDQIYNVILVQRTGGTITATPMTGYAGDVITLSSHLDSNYTLDGWDVTGATLNGNQITIGNTNPTVAGRFTENQIYNLTLQQTNGGTITADRLTGYKDDIVTLYNTPSSQYNFSSYNITGATLTGNLFKFNNSNVTAKANFVTGAYEFVPFTASGYFAPVSTYEISQNVNGSGSVTFQNYGTLVYTGGQGVPSDWIQSIAGINSAFMPNTASISGATARLYNSLVDCSAYFKNSNNQNINFNYKQDKPYIRFTLEDIDGVYNEAHTIAYSFKENDYELVYGGKICGKDNYYDNTYFTVTYNTLPGGFNWYTMYSANVSANATGAYWNMAHPGDYNFWVMSGGYYHLKPVRNVIINSVPGGTVSPNKLTGYDGDVVTLSQTANANYTFNNYSITGSTLTGSQFKFNGSNVTAKGNYTYTEPDPIPASAQVKIGNQTWMKVNLASSDGGAGIMTANISYNGINYGKQYYYDWNAATRIANKIGGGWRLPTSADWYTLFNAVGGTKSAKDSLRTTAGWDGRQGTDLYGFGIIPVGSEGQAPNPGYSFNDLLSNEHTSTSVRAFSFDPVLLSTNIWYMTYDEDYHTTVRLIKDS